MADPYRPRVRRTVAGTLTPLTPAGPGEFPAERIARLGGDVDYWRDVLDSLSETDRAESIASWDAMTDVELAATFADDPILWAPVGTIDEILAWTTAVDGPERVARARAALSNEESGRRRKGLLAPLRSLARD